MSTLPVAPQPEQRPPLRRYPDRALLGGVALGISEHLHTSPLPIRIGLLALLIPGIVPGLVLYGLLWLLIPQEEEPEEAPGLEAATRGGSRPARRRGTPDAGLVVSFGLVALGVGWLVLTSGYIPQRVFWPVVMGGSGVLLVWLQVDRRAPREPSDATTRWRRFVESGTLASVARILAGAVLFLLGGAWLLTSQVGLGQVPQVLGASFTVVGAVALVASPWLRRLRNRVRHADERRLRAEAKADMAAHLHDSVLQTLTLIQRQPEQAATLARRQERELRAWLYGDEIGARTVKAALEQMRRDVEEHFPISVEVVCVGDATLDDAGRTVMLATKEATTNAAKHSGAERVDVYVEVEPEKYEVFVRDRGRGFDLAQVPADRWGVKQSIQARMHRHGGTAQVKSAVGEGTEVRLEIRRDV